MEAFNQAKTIIQAVVSAYGVFLILKGGVTFFGGYSNHQGNEMRDGGASIIGGAGIVLLANILIPLINVG